MQLQESFRVVIMHGLTRQIDQFIMQLQQVFINTDPMSSKFVHGIVILIWRSQPWEEENLYNFQ